MFRDQMKQGDLAFFYHSSCAEPGVVGVMEVVSNAYPDPTQFDPKADHYDPASTREEPRWLLVDVKFQRKFEQPVSLATLRAHEKKLAGLRILEKGSRLSVTPVRKEHWEAILKLAGA
jgi:predicted RNA-binding protein with PUA-like domain